ncbi:hypothetical protein [Humibacter ginsengisoli]
MEQSKRRPVVVVAAAAALVLALCGCTGPTHPSSTTSATPSAGATELPVKDAIAKIMANGKDLPVLGTSNGTINGPGDQPAKVVAQVLQVSATSDATLVVWRLGSATHQTVSTTSIQLSHPPLFDTRLLGVVDPRAKITYRPYTYVPIQGNGEDNSCLCSDLPSQVDGEGELLYAVVPPLPSSVKSVDLTLPGFADIKGIKVGRSK